jgi:hypothetical protein
MSDTIKLGPKRFKPLRKEAEPVADAPIKLEPALVEAPKPVTITMPEPDPEPAPHDNPNEGPVERIYSKRTRDEIAAGQATLRKYGY